MLRFLILLITGVFVANAIDHQPDEVSPLQPLVVPINSFDHFDDYISNYQPSSHPLLLAASSTSLSVFPLFTKLSSTCGGLIGDPSRFPVFAALCGTGGGLSISTIFFVTLYNAKELIIPKGPSEIFDNEAKDYLKHGALCSAYFIIGWSASCPVYYLNMTQLPAFSNVIPRGAMIAWSQYNQTLAGAGDIWPCYALIHEYLLPLVRKVPGLASEVKKQRLEIKNALAYYAQTIQGMEDEQLERLYNQMFEPSTLNGQSKFNHLLIEAFTAYTEKKGLTPVEFIADTMAASLGILSGYSLWPMSIASVQSWNLPSQALTSIVGNTMGACSFFTSGALNAIAAYSNFHYFLHLGAAIPDIAKKTPLAVKNYFTTPGTVKEKLEPIVRGVSSAAAIYLSVDSAFSSMNVNSMVSSGLWEGALQISTVIANTSTTYFCYSSIASTVNNWFFRKPIQEKRDRLSSLVQELSRQMTFIKNQHIELFYNTKLSVNPI